MTIADQPAPRPRDLTPTSFLAAAALTTINEALRTARTPRDAEQPEPAQAGSRQALAALLLLREVRDQLAEWEPDLIEEAREAGASWADLAHPLGVSSRQAAERRYLRVRPGNPGSTGEQRVRATRDRRAADRTVTAWARANAADLRQLAGQITALADLPAAARTPLVELTAALADNDAAVLLGPLADTHTYLASGHPDLAARVDDIARHTARLRRHSGEQRREPRKPPGP
ncbi:type III effector protein [Streptomyces sp. DSM 40750]|uniref:type III effector protein n=1 Tax=Streptomyces sp. DSM 40750 TaxID=2801030 RepID=UPI00214CD24E|nr:type III effector protein [Streptomyces sp. DSM 40750]UUU19380.1 type III effector protein [Streptomyces sp. DSM 40750]UUU27276.1 type III effector protein [Streptomyces sp. DSM 40750]